MTVYQWKTPGLYNVDPAIAGDFLNGIYEDEGKIDPASVVERSKPEEAPLHHCFEWNDEIAAGKYREQQARTLIANVVVSEQPTEQSYTRAFVHVENEYQPLYVVLESPHKAQELLESALRELRTFERKYRELEELVPVFQAIEKVA